MPAYKINRNGLHRTEKTTRSVVGSSELRNQLSRIRVIDPEGSICLGNWINSIFFIYPMRVVFSEGF